MKSGLGTDMGGDADQRYGDADTGQGNHNGQSSRQHRAEHDEQDDQGGHHPGDVTSRSAPCLERIPAEGHRQAGRMGETFDGAGCLPGVTMRAIVQLNGA